MKHKIHRYGGRNKGDESEWGSFQLIKVVLTTCGDLYLLSAEIQRNFPKSESQYVQTLMEFQIVFFFEVN